MVFGTFPLRCALKCLQRLYSYPYISRREAESTAERSETDSRRLPAGWSEATSIDLYSRLKRDAARFNLSRRASPAGVAQVRLRTRATSQRVRESKIIVPPESSRMAALPPALAAALAAGR